MSDDISQLIGRLRSYARSSKGDIYAAADTIEALRAERDRLKDEVERLRGEQRLRSLIGPSENAVERIIAERDRLKAALVGVIDFIASEEWREAHTALEQIVNRIRKALEAK